MKINESWVGMPKLILCILCIILIDWDTGLGYAKQQGNLINLMLITIVFVVMCYLHAKFYSMANQGVS